MSNNNPKLLLAAVNSKYIHSNLALYSLQKFAEATASAEPAEAVESLNIEIAEYTINQPYYKILQDIIGREPKVLFLSCYIWNTSIMKSLVSDISKVRPELDIWLGGPEVTYDPEMVFETMPAIRGIIRGEGERAFAELAQAYTASTDQKVSEPQQLDEKLQKISDITYRDAQGAIIAKPPTRRMPLDDIPFVYDDLSGFENRIIYYESSRGCPFRCSYCLSSVDKTLSFRSAGKVTEELQFFLDHQVPQVKFIDRTFNCDHDRTVEIWKYIREHDNGITNFHFEIAADIMTDEELEILAEMRPGLVQLEIGVQSTNLDTIHEINRPMDFTKVSSIVRRILDKGNVHVHLDLIAGLPYEDAASFRKSFNDVFALRPHQLQLGFLKVLSGSPMEANAEKYGLKYSETQPYEVLQTRWISFDELSRLKYIEEMVDSYYNSGQFGKSLEYLAEHGGVMDRSEAGSEAGGFDEFSIFEGLADWYREHDMVNINLSRNTRYENLLDFARELLAPEHHDGFMQALVYDFYARDNVRSRPEFLGEETVDKKFQHDFYMREAEEHSMLTDEKFVEADNRQLRKLTHLERIGEDIYLFDYTERDQVTGNVRVRILQR